MFAVVGRCWPADRGIFDSLQPSKKKKNKKERKRCQSWILSGSTHVFYMYRTYFTSIVKSLQCTDLEIISNYDKYLLKVMNINV